MKTLQMKNISKQFDLYETNNTNGPVKKTDHKFFKNFYFCLNIEDYFVRLLCHNAKLGASDDYYILFLSCGPKSK